MRNLTGLGGIAWFWFFGELGSRQNGLLAFALLGVATLGMVATLWAVWATGEKDVGRDQGPSGSIEKNQVED